MMETGDDDDHDSVMPSTDDSSTGSSRKKSFMIREIDVKRAKLQLDKIWEDAPENAPGIDEEGDPAWGPIVLCDKITWEDFDQWLGVHEGDVRCWCSLMMMMTTTSCMEEYSCTAFPQIFMWRQPGRFCK